MTCLGPHLSLELARLTAAGCAFEDMAGFFGLIAVAVIRRHALCFGQTWVDWWVGYVEKGRGQQKCLYTESLLNLCYLVFCWVLCLEKNNYILYNYILLSAAASIEILNLSCKTYPP